MTTNNIDMFGNPIANQQAADEYAPLSIDSFGSAVEPVAPQPPTIAVRSKSERLASSRAQKVERLQAKAGLSLTDMSEAYTVLDGANESLKNKVLNDYDPAVLDYVITRMNNEFGVVATDKGFMRQDAEGNYTPYEGDVNALSSFYHFKTKEGSDKYGIWGGIDPTGRYSEEYLSSRSKPEMIGPKGVDPSRLEKHYLMPVSNNDLIEALIHGNKTYMANRALRYTEGMPVEEYRRLKAEYGTGATEIYTPFDKGTLPENFDGDAVWKEFTGKYRPESRGVLTEEERIARYNALADATYREAEESFLNRVGNVVQGTGATATRALLVDTADFLGDVTSVYDIGTADEKRSMVNDWFGYNSTFSDEAAAKAKEHVTKLYKAYKNNEEMDMADVYGAIWAGMSPELLAESLTETVALLIGVGKITKTGKAISSVEKSYRAGQITKEAAKVAVKQIKKDATFVDAAKFFVANNAGYINQVANVTNDTVDTFRENNEGTLGVTDVARMTAVNALALGLDRFAGAVVLRDIPGVPTATATIRKLLPGGPDVTAAQRKDMLKTVLSDLTPAEYTRLAKPAIATIAYASKATGNAVVEGVTEYAQTLAEVFNAQYATKKYGSDAAKILLSDAAQIDALTGAALGAGMGGATSAVTPAIAGTVQMIAKGTGLVKTALGKASAAVQSAKATTVNMTKDLNGETAGLQQEITPEASEEQRLTDKDTYITSLNRLHTLNVNNEFVPENLADYVNELETLKRTRYSLSDSPKESVANADKALQAVETAVAGIIRNHTDGKIKLSSVMTGKTVLGSSPKSQEMLPDNVRKAVVEAVTDILHKFSKGELTATEVEKLMNFATINEVDRAVVTNTLKSYQSVGDEALLGNRGVRGRSRSLDLLLSTGTASPVTIRREYNEAASFYVTTVSSIDALAEGIKRAEEIAVTNNRSIRKDMNTAPIEVVTEYKTDASSSSQGRPFTIYVRYKNGSWVADTAEAEKRIKAKEVTAKGLRQLLNRFRNEASDYLDVSRLLLDGEYQPRATNTESSSSGNEPSEGDASVDTEAPTAGVVEDVAEEAATEEPTKETTEEPTKETTEEPIKETTEESAEEVAEEVATEVLGEEEESAAYQQRAEAFARMEIKSRLAAIAIEEILVAAGQISKTAKEIREELALVVKDARRVFDHKVIKNVVTAPLVFKDVAGSEDALVSSSEQYFMDNEAAIAENVSVVLTQEVPFEVTRNWNVNVRNYMEAVKDTLFTGAEDVVALYGETIPREELFIGAIAAGYEKHLQKTADVSEAFKAGWKEVAARKLRGNALIGAVNSALKSVGLNVRSKLEEGESFEGTLLLRNEATKLLETAAGTKHKNKSVVLLGKVDGKVTSYTVLARTPDMQVGRTIQLNKQDFLITNINDITIDPNDYLQVSKTTAVNTLPTKYFPEVFTKGVKDTRAILRSIISPLTEAELSGRRDGSENKGKVYWFSESPARTFMFNTAGSISDTFLNAMNIALNEVMYTEVPNMLEGPKDIATVARTFNVPEFDVTEDMIELSSTHGVLAKSVANAIGTKLLGALGISGRNNTEANVGHYERLATDLGNIGIEVLSAIGAIKLNSIASDEIEGMVTDDGMTVLGEESGSGAITWFVSVPFEVTGFGVGANQNARAYQENYVKMTEFVKDPTGSVKEPFFGVMPKKVKEKYLSSVRKSLVGGVIPQAAKDALDSFMSTPYELNVKAVKDFLDKLEVPELAQGIKKSLGYVNITPHPDADDGAVYTAMLFDDKVIQASINEGIDRSISYLRDMYEKVVNNQVPNKMFFGFYYTTNHRYMMDSTRINPQGDKLHRFFVQPKAHKDTYKVNKRTNTFSAVANGKTVDVSLYVRAALAQAFGVGIDKENTDEIVRVGNALLSVKEHDLNQLEKDMLTNGKVTIVADGSAMTFKLDHVSHFLTAVQFLRDYATSTETVTSSLTAETDALTSGFSNKIQQYAYFGNDPKDLETHARRVGVIKNETTRNLFNEAGTVYGINDMLSDPESLDSYQNLGIQVIKEVESNIEILEPPQRLMFDGVKELIPGFDQVGKANKVVSPALRKLFKPAFMIFNYSAGINRIVKNTTGEMALNVLREISSADLSDKSTPAYKAATVIGNRFQLSPHALQKNLRGKFLARIRLTLADGTKESVLDVIREEAIVPTYGRAIEGIFRSEFEFFSDIQDTTNDAFRLIYEVFNARLLEEVKRYRGEENKPVSETAFKQIIKSLVNDFPVIAGPLSQSLEEGVYVYGVSTKTPEDALNFTSPAVGKFLDKQRKLNPILKAMTAAANSGSVLPFHAIDGAQLAKTAVKFMQENKLKTAGSAMTPIHDAMMVPLKFMDTAAYIYNRETVDINSSYSILAELVKMLGNAQKSDQMFKDLKPVKGLKIRNILAYADRAAQLNELKTAIKRAESRQERQEARKVYDKAVQEAFSFPEDFDYVVNKLDWLNKAVEEGRKTFYKNGDKVGVMVGLASSVYTVGEHEMRTDILAGLKSSYKAASVTYGAVAPDIFVMPLLDVLDFAARTKNEVKSAGDANVWGKAAKRSNYVNNYLGDGKKVAKGNIVLAVVPDKENEYDRDTEVEWGISVEEAQYALSMGGILAFGDVMNTAEDTSNPTTGEVFLFNQLLENPLYTTAAINVEGEIMTLVVRKEYVEIEETTNTEATTSDIIAPNKTRTALVDRLQRFQELSKRCKK